MSTSENESHKVRLERIIRNELLSRIEFIAGKQPEHFVEYLIQNCKLITVTKDQHLEESRSFEDGKLFYICKGIARSYYYDTLNNKPIITRIWTKHGIIFNINSFQNKEERTESIQMMEDGEIICMGYTGLNNLLVSFPKMYSCMLWLQAEREKYAIFYQRLLKLNVEERVRLYLDNNPGIISRINNDYIALHLGINRSRLSGAYKAYRQEAEGPKSL